MSFENMKSKEAMKNKWYIVLILLFIGAAMWVLNFLTPEYNDDYFYKFMFIGNEFNTNYPIHSFRDILISQYNHYFGYNGRSVVHVIVQLFTGIWGKAVFNIFNAIAMVVFVYLLTRITIKVNMLNLFFVSTIILFLYPQFSHTVLWMTGSINYVWTSAIVCLFLFALRKYEGIKLQLVHFLWFIPCVLAGWTHEGITFPLATSLGIYAIINRKTILQQATLPLIAGFIIGALLCSFSPAILARASVTDGVGFSELLLKIRSGFILCTNIKAFYVLVICVVIAYFMNKQNALKQLYSFYCKNIIVSNALIFSFGVVFLSGHEGVRAAIGVELYSIILLLRFINSRICESSLVVYIKKIVIIAAAGWYCCIVYYSIPNYQEYKNILVQIKSKKSDVITYKNKQPKYLGQFILPSILMEQYCYSSMRNTSIATIYDCKRLAFIPSFIYNDIISHSDKIIDIKKQDGYPFYVIPVDSSSIDRMPVFILRPVDFNNMPFYYFRPFVTRMNKYTVKEVGASSWLCDVITIRDQNYLLVGKNETYDFRLKEIKLR